MSKFKKMFTIALGFALATYLIMSGLAILNKENSQNKESISKS